MSGEFLVLGNRWQHPFHLKCFLLDSYCVLCGQHLPVFWGVLQQGNVHVSHSILVCTPACTQVNHVKRPGRSS